MASSRVPVAIVGAGSVAQALGRLMAARGEPIVALASRTRLRAEQAAHFIGGPVRVVTCAEVPRLATRVLVAVADRALAPVAETLAAAGLRSGVALHTCGARGPEALGPLRAAGVSCGVLHPLQTIATPEQGVASLVNITFGLCGDRPALDWAEHIVTLLDGRSLQVAPDRLNAYHAGAVMASNAIVAVLDAALALLARAGVERKEALHALGPLARTSLENVLAHGPTAAMTGPIARGDATTVAAHMNAIREATPTVAALYGAVAAHLLELAKARGLPEREVRSLQAAIDAGSGGRGSTEIGT